MARTPMGKMSGGLSALTAPQLASHAIRAAMDRVATTSNGVVFDKQWIEEAYLGNVVSAGIGQAPSRQAVIYSDLPLSVPCTDVNKVCASGMKAIMLGAMSISTGYRSCVLAGGMESMSNIPYYMPKATRAPGFRLGHQQITDGLIADGLWDIYNNQHMGSCGEICAKDFGITREDQDKFAIESYTRAANAWKSVREKNTSFHFVYGLSC